MKKQIYTVVYKRVYDLHLITKEFPADTILVAINNWCAGTSSRIFNFTFISVDGVELNKDTVHAQLLIMGVV